jgi:quercetin dioxygenase-like cupin family protein
MATAGTVLESAAGERMVFRRTAADTNGELLQYDLFLGPRGQSPPPHAQPTQEERFTVLSGTLDVCVRNTQRRVTAGEVLVVPKGTTHTVWNGGTEEAHLLVEMRPALNAEQFFEDLMALSAPGSSSRQSRPNPLQMAVLVTAHRETVALPAPVSVLFRALALVGRWRGYRPRYI